MKKSQGTAVPSTKIEELEAQALADLKRSGLDAEDFKALRLEVLTRDQTDEFVGEPRASYRIPYFDLDGKLTAYSRVRFLETRQQKGFNSKKKGSFRYSQPFNSSPHVYFPPYLNWRKVANDPSVKILITEGEKKAAKACRSGIVCIALGGVYGYKSQKRLWDFIPELQEIKWTDRQVEICYDADVMLKAEVRQAINGLAFTLSQSYSPASIEFVFLDAETAGSKTGLDDYLVEHGPKAFNEIVRQPYRANAKIQLLNQKLCYVERQTRFFDLKSQTFFKSFHHAREAFMNEGEELIDKRQVLIIDLWGKSANRRCVRDVTYVPGEEEVTDDGDLNLWKPSECRPRRGSPKRWVELVHHIMRTPEYADWFLKWLAYPLQNPGAKLLQAVFVYGQKQGIGKTFVVDPVMETIYGKTNFHRLQNNDITSAFNAYAGRKQFVVTNEIYLPEYRDRRAAMSALKDMITRERVSVNEKFQPSMTYTDHCNYYFTSNHADALVLEKGDRRFFIIEAPDEKLDQGIYDELDEWVRGEGAGVIAHYLQNTVDLSGFNPKADAMMTTWKRQLIELSRDALSEFGERVIEDAESLFMVNGNLPDLHLWRAEDMLRVFEMTYPRYRFNVTVNRMARILSDARIEKRKVRLSVDSPQQVLYAVFERDEWADKKNKEWAEHYVSNAKKFGGSGRH